MWTVQYLLQVKAGNGLVTIFFLLLLPSADPFFFFFFSCALVFVSHVIFLFFYHFICFRVYIFESNTNITLVFLGNKKGQVEIENVPMRMKQTCSFISACLSTKSSCILVIDNPGPGGTHIFGRTGMCRSNGSLFYKKSLNMGPVFYQKILKHGSTFLNEHKIWQFWGFCHAKTPKIAKFLKNRPKMALFFTKNP